MLDNV
jgi:hypothetical protein